jgi:hypothetical protein
MLRLLPWGHLNLSEINSIAVANSRMSAAPKSPSHPPHHLRRPVRPKPQHPEQQRYHRPQQGEGDARAGHNEMRPGRRTLLHVRLSVGLGGIAVDPIAYPRLGAEVCGLDELFMQHAAVGSDDTL